MIVKRLLASSSPRLLTSSSPLSVGLERLECGVRGDVEQSSVVLMEGLVQQRYSHVGRVKQ